MTKTDDQLNNEIGQLLFKSSPNGAKKVIAQLEFTPEMDACTCIFDYYNQNDELNWYTLNSDITSPLIKAVRELRQYYIDNNLTNGLPVWRGCIITVDIENAKIDFEFKYERFIPLFEDDDLKD
ncbi:hypothetical protein H3S88_11655 [Gilliamella sp. B14448G11]|uniref:hypothetical protein n=1 Tax=unclassified Gilliamella TaxID=2685620 RepID=UPI0018DCD256|nr:MULTISPECIES: hypothetical protein [unclassified Gilliamella]MBI0029355.1 hypothetical protein [Gilliamella sp. B14448G7]MBI0036314.1 hypothetical protein [Gilliamella sp. B14448G11]MBI0043499.1 hypothetical protein [Gilliamella sp. B14448G12]